VRLQRRKGERWRTLFFTQLRVFDAPDGANKLQRSLNLVLHAFVPNVACLSITNILKMRTLCSRLPTSIKSRNRSLLLNLKHSLRLQVFPFRCLPTLHALFVMRTSFVLALGLSALVSASANAIFPRDYPSESLIDNLLPVLSLMPVSHVP
jgi:hypothetical protein